MEEFSFIEDWRVIRFDPAAVYRPTSLDTYSMCFELSRKVAELSKKHDLPSSTFSAWLLSLENEISAIFLYVPEIVSDKLNPITAIVVQNEKGPIADVIGKVMSDKMPFIHAGFISWDSLFTSLAFPQSGGIMRSFLMSELCVLLRGESDHDKADSIKEKADVIFRNDPVSDLAEIIAFDVTKKLGKPIGKSVDLMADASKPKVVSNVSDDEFASIAIAKMEKRRILPHIHDRLVPKVKKAFVR